jgi:hypothetical protein
MGRGKDWFKDTFGDTTKEQWIEIGFTAGSFLPYVGDLVDISGTIYYGVKDIQSKDGLTLTPEGKWVADPQGVYADMLGEKAQWEYEYAKQVQWEYQYAKYLAKEAEKEEIAQAQEDKAAADKAAEEVPLTILKRPGIDVDWTKVDNEGQYREYGTIDEYGNYHPEWVIHEKPPEENREPLQYKPIEENREPLQDKPIEENREPLKETPIEENRDSLPEASEEEEEKSRLFEKKKKLLASFQDFVKRNNTFVHLPHTYNSSSFCNIK